VVAIPDSYPKPSNYYQAELSNTATMALVAA